jgi:hypothetical protein
MWSRRRRILLVDSVDRVTVRELRVHCRGLADQGWRRVVLDASAVTGCDRPGLLGLTHLAHGRAGLEVELTGLRWSQFFPALQATPLAELRATHRQIRALIEGTDLDHEAPGCYHDPDAPGVPGDPERRRLSRQRGRRRLPARHPVA